MTQHQAVHTGGENLFDHPGVRANRRSIQTDERQRDDDGRRPVSALGRSAVDESLHELAQALRLERTVFHFVLDQIVCRLCELLPFFVAAAGDADVVHRLPRVEQLDHLVQAFRLAVVRIAALSRHQCREGESDEGKRQDKWSHRKPRIREMPRVVCDSLRP